MTTKTKSLADRLRTLKATRDRAHAEVLERRQAVEAWDTEGLPPEVRPGGHQAEIYAARREKEHGPNPHRDKYEAALATFTALDAELQAFTRDTLATRIAEVVVDAGDHGIRDALETLRHGLEAARLDVAEVRNLILDTPGINGQALTFDGRLDEWYEFTREALRGLDEAELVKPGLTEIAAWKLVNDG